jgi:hypothetical protein
VQAVLVIDALPAGGIDAAATFHAQHLAQARALIADPGTDALAIALPAAGPDHDDWRRTLARDLARAHSPKRVNVVATRDPCARAAMLAYLGDAPGVTGQYLAAHE